LALFPQGFSPGLKEENIRGLLSISCSLALFSQGFGPGKKEEKIRDLLSVNCSIAVIGDQQRTSRYEIWRERRMVAD
jgi:hypothetical protein